jgi:hypothetical protein
MSFWELLQTPEGFQGQEPTKSPSLRAIAPLVSQGSFLEPPLSASAIVVPPSKERLAAHPLFQGISSDAEIVRLKRENPECVELIDYCIRRFGSKIPEQYRSVFIQDLVQEFKTRTNRRTSQRMIELMSQPCFEIEIQSFMNQLNRTLKSSEELKSEEKTQYIKAMFKALTVPIVHGIAETYHAEIFSENGIVTHPITQRGVQKWSRAPCGIRMRHEDYERLSPHDKRIVDEVYQRYGLQSERAQEALGVEGGRKKTRRRRNKKQTKKVNVGKRSRKIFKKT